MKRNNLADLWAGEFGNQYTDRNMKIKSRDNFWKMIAQFLPEKAWCFEVGCNIGTNLLSLNKFVKNGELWGCDVNQKAMDIANSHGDLNIFDADATTLPMDDESVDIVFTCGVLIHLDDKAVERCMKEMLRISNNYILMVEYYSDNKESVTYRGIGGLLFKRPYDAILESIGNVKLVKTGFLGVEEGFDNCTYWLYRKTK